MISPSKSKTTASRRHGVTAQATSASTRPSMVWTVGLDVDGQAVVARGRGGDRADAGHDRRQPRRRPNGVDEALDRGRRREGDRRRRPRPRRRCVVGDGGGHGPVGVDDVDRPSPARAARRAARRGPPRPGPAAPARARSGNASRSASATNRSGTRSATMPPPASTAAVPGPMAATLAPPKRARRRRPGTASSSRRGAVRRGDDDPVVGAEATRGRGAARRRRRPGRRSRSPAPRSARRRPRAGPTASCDACWRVRVTTTRRPNSGRRSNHARSSPATSPTTITDGVASGWSAIVASVARTVVCSGRVPHRTAATGRVGRQAPGHELVGDPADAGDAHEDHDRAADLGDGPPVDACRRRRPPGPRGR